MSLRETFFFSDAPAGQILFLNPVFPSRKGQRKNKSLGLHA